jgi:aspartate beta-hydroxylase
LIPRLFLTGIPEVNASDDPLIAEYELALGAGDQARAEDLAQQVVSRDECDEAAFIRLVIAARRHNHPDLAIRLAALGLARQPASALLQGQQGLALAASRRFAEAEPVLALAVRNASDDLLFHLAHGHVLARLGRTEDSVAAHFRTLELAERLGQNWETLPDDVKAGLNAAHSAVMNVRAEAVTQALHEVRQRYAPGSFRRVHQAIQAYFSGQQPVPPHPLQRPTFLFIPGLPDRPWFEREEFPFLLRIEEQTDVIRSELMSVLSEPDRLRPYVDMSEHAPAAAVWKDLNHSSEWSSFHFLRHGKQIEENCRRCPRTLAALEELPLHRVPDHGPEAMFSVLQPRTRIPPHTGVVNGRLTVHLPLVVPKDCGRLRAGGESRAWQEGKCLIFDDSFVHEAWNDSDEVRAVLIFDLWNPYLQEPEREAMSAAIAAIGNVSRRHGSKDPSLE